MPGHDETAVQHRVETAPKKKRNSSNFEKKEQLQYSNNNDNSYSVNRPHFRFDKFAGFPIIDFIYVFAYAFLKLFFQQHLKFILSPRNITPIKI